jgi:hypothetical protein
MWGARKGAIRRKVFDSLLNLSPEEQTTPNGDQVWVNKFLWKGDLESSANYYSHDSVLCEKFNAVPFPVNRIGADYVGRQYDEYDWPLDTPSAELLFSPESCRTKPKYPFQ